MLMTSKTEMCMRENDEKHFAFEYEFKLRRDPVDLRQHFCSKYSDEKENKL